MEMTLKKRNEVPRLTQTSIKEKPKKKCLHNLSFEGIAYLSALFIKGSL